MLENEETYPPQFPKAQVNVIWNKVLIQNIFCMLID